MNERLKDIFLNDRARTAIVLNVFFCVLSMLAVHTAAYRMFAIAFAAGIFLSAQGLILFLFKGSSHFRESLSRYWPLFLAVIIAMVRTLITLAQCYMNAGLAQGYAKMGILLTVLIFYTIALFAVLFMEEQFSLVKLFALQAGVFGTVLCVVFPVYGVTDEPQHLRTAYSLSNFMMGIQSPENAIMMRQDDAEYTINYESYTLTDMTQYMSDLSQPLKNGNLIAVYDDMPWSQTMEYARRPKVFKTEIYQYIAPAAGITIGRLLGLNTIVTYLLARFFNLLFYILIVCLALKLIPVGKTLLFTIALLPMNLHLAASASRDVFRFCAAVFVLALTLYLFYDEERNRKYDKAAVIALIISSLLLLPLRTYVYSMVAVLPLLLLLYRKHWLTDRMIRVFLIICFSLAILAIIVKYVFFPGNIIAEPQVGLSYSTELRYTWQYFVNHPLHFLSIIRNTFWGRTDWYIDTMIGSQLGWLNVNVPAVLIRIFTLSLLIHTASRSYEKITLPKGLRAVLLGMGALSICLMIAGMTITWTPITYSSVEGIQGRYFLPILLPILLALRTKHIQTDEKCDRICICIQFAALLFTAEFMLLRLL